MPITTLSSATVTQGGPFKLDDNLAPDDNTDLNASSSAHGLLPKLSNVATEFLTGTGTWAAPSGGVPAAHAASHQNGGSDEISVAGLSGLLADSQTPLAHAASHKDGGSDVLLLHEFGDPTSSVEFAQQQALQFRLENRTSDPGSPAVGQVWLRTDL